MKMIVRQIVSKGYMVELIPAAIKETPKLSLLERLKKFTWRLSK